MSAIIPTILNQTKTHFNSAAACIFTRVFLWRLVQCKQTGRAVLLLKMQQTATCVIHRSRSPKQRCSALYSTYCQVYYSGVHGEWLLSEWCREVNGSWSTISISTLGCLCVHLCERERKRERPLQQSNVNTL